MEEQFTLTRSEIVEAFRKWRADDLAGNCGGDLDDVEASADAFLKYAGLAPKAEG